MVATRSKSTGKLRQSRLDFGSTPTVQSSPLQTRAAKAAAETNVTKKQLTTRPKSNFLGTSHGKKQTYFAETSDEGSDTPRRPAPRDKPDSENLMATQAGKAIFVYDETDSDEEDDIPLATSSIRKRKRPARNIISSDESSEAEESDGVQETSPPPKLRKTKATPDGEEDDLADDLEFLRSSPPAITPRGARSKKNERAKALEDLRRTREKRKPKPSPAKSKRKVVSDSDSDSLQLVDEPDSDCNEGSGTEAEEAEADEEDADAYEVFDEHEFDRDFIASEDEEVEDHIGVPTEAIPIELTHWATAKPRELFKFAVEWFVQKKINPGFNRNDEIYGLTWQKLDDEITGLVGSKYTSSAWTRDFTYSLRGRPRLLNSRVDWEGTDCEACGRSNHPATYQIQFTGAPYDLHYEDVEQDTDDEENGITRDKRGSIIPPESRTYKMGKTCYGNAVMAHRLKHWRYSLGEWVLEYLTEIGELAPDKIVERDGWKEVMKRNYANDIVRRMEDENEIKNLYSAMKSQVSSARGTEDWDH